LKFCTAISCIDGRVQIPVHRYMQERYGAEYVDTITEPGPCRILSSQSPLALVESILSRLKISVEKHASCHVAIVAHEDCAGNPVSKDQQLEHLRRSVDFVKMRFPELEVIALWVDSSGSVTTVV